MGIALVANKVEYIAVGISLLSCTETEIHAMSYLLPVNGRHLGFTTHIDIGQHAHEVYPSEVCCYTKPAR